MPKLNKIKNVLNFLDELLFNVPIYLVFLFAIYKVNYFIETKYSAE
jgi:hypothetical protein